MEGLSGPLPRDVRARLRRAVAEHSRVESRRAFPPALHIGRPGGPVARLELDVAEDADPGLRTDIVAALRARADASPDHLVWLTRAGSLEIQDVDARWLSAARAAYAEAELPLTYVVVNRRGWRDPRSGAGRSWSRVRPSWCEPDLSGA